MNNVRETYPQRGNLSNLRRGDQVYVVKGRPSHNSVGCLVYEGKIANLTPKQIEIEWEEPYRHATAPEDAPTTMRKMSERFSREDGSPEWKSGRLYDYYAAPRTIENHQRVVVIKSGEKYAATVDDLAQQVTTLLHRIKDRLPRTYEAESVTTLEKLRDVLAPVLVYATSPDSYHVINIAVTIHDSVQSEQPNPEPLTPPAAPLA